VRNKQNKDFKDLLYTLQQTTVRRLYLANWNICVFDQDDDLGD